MITKWYIPGMISLIGILPLFIWKTRPLQEQFDQRVMNVYLPKEGDIDDRLMMFSDESILKDVGRKRQTPFFLNDFIEQRQEMLEGIRLAAQNMKFGYDTSKVIKVVFGSHCTFNDLVSVMNICLMDEHKRWAWVKDSIFIFAPDPPRIHEQYITCGYNAINYLEPTSLKWYEEFLEVIAENTLLISGYLILTIAIIFFRWNYFKNQKL